MKIAVGKGASQVGACKILCIGRTTVRYERRPEDPANLLIREELRLLSKRHKRYGTPRMTELVSRRFGKRYNHKRIERLWKEESLPVPRRRSRKRRGAVSDQRPHEAARKNDVWSYDFVHDKTLHGEKIKMLTVVDEFTRECLEIRVEKRMNGTSVLETLDELMTERGKPRYTRSDNGPEFISKVLNSWLEEKGVKSLFIDPGCPWQNGYVESFNGKLRDECLNEETYWTRAEAQVLVDWWREVYNHERPHSSLGMKTPAEVSMESEYGRRN